MSNAYPGALAQGEASLVQREYMMRVYGWMASGLGITGLVAYEVAQYIERQWKATGEMPISQGAMMALFLAQIGLVIVLSLGVRKLPATLATALFLGYAALTGVTMSFVFLVYTQQSIAATFVVTAGTFGAMSVYGAVTKRDLTAMGSMLSMLLFGLIIASVVNMFVASNALSWGLTYLGVLVFVGFTAYDTQKILEIGDNCQNAAIVGALALYLDFINLFLDLLRIMGKKRN